MSIQDGKMTTFSSGYNVNVNVSTYDISTFSLLSSGELVVGAGSSSAQPKRGHPAHPHHHQG